MSYSFYYYNHSYIPSEPEVPIKENLSFRKIYNTTNVCACIGGGYPVFASYITEFDCAEETDWWFTIKDDSYDLSKLSAKKRYEITKAHKFCHTEKINPNNYFEELFEVYKKSFEGYQDVERPKNIFFCDFKNYLEELISKKKIIFYACFNKENDKLIGFLIIEKRGNILGLKQQKTIPEYEKYNSNASLLDAVLNDYNEELKKRKIFFSNGSRTIRHQSNFNAYLEKYFGFRKAYAKLVIVYRLPFGIIVVLLKPFMKLLEKTKNPLLYNLSCVLKMDSFKYKK